MEADHAPTLPSLLPIWNIFYIGHFLCRLVLLFIWYYIIIIFCFCLYCVFLILFATSTTIIF